MEFHIDCQETIKLHSSAALVKTILANLIENAVFFSPLRSMDHARVEVKVTTQGNALQLSVYDNEVGIGEDVTAVASSSAPG